MKPPDDRWRKNIVKAGAAFLILALALTWALSRGANPGDDNPQELLRKAASPEGAVAPKTRISKSFTVQGTSSSGPMTAEVLKVEEQGGRGGFVLPALAKPLKEGETATLKMPGGGTVLMRVGPEVGPSTLAPKGGNPPSK